MENNFRQATDFERNIAKQVIDHLESHPAEDFESRRFIYLLVREYINRLKNAKGFADYIQLRLGINRKTVYKYNKEL